MNPELLQNRRKQIEVQIASESQAIARNQQQIQQLQVDVERRTGQVLILQGALGGVLMALGEDVPQGLLPESITKHVPVAEQPPAPPFPRPVE